MWGFFFVHPPEAYRTGELVFGNVADPLWWWLGAGAAVLVIIAAALTGRRTRGWRWWQKASVATLQSLTVLGVIGLLAGPGLRLTTLEPGANSVALLADTSGSMSYPDTVAADAPSRFEAAQALAAGALGETIAPVADLAVFEFDSGARRVGDVAELSLTDANTHLVSAVDAVLSSFKGTPLAAVVVLSDGADNDAVGAQDLARLAAHGVPVHTVGFGPTRLAGEVRLSDVQLTADAPPESRVTARVVVEHAAAGEALIKVRDAGTLIATRRIELPADTPTVRTEIGFDAGESGIRDLSFEVQPPPAADGRPGDQLAGNNRIDRLLTVSDRKRRVLYLEGEPRWEYKFLRRAVAGDDVLELVSWLKTTNRKTYRQGVSEAAELADGFPATRAALYGYDVVVLGSLAAAELSADQHRWLETFVSERGGSVLALAGRNALDDGRWDVQPLAAALPVHLSRGDTPGYNRIRGQARPTALGARSPFTQLVDAEGGDGWASLPALGDLQHLGDLKPAATTLLELVSGDDAANDASTVHPLLVVQPYGLGTTAILATASTWRWQMRTPPEDPRHRLFWRQLLRQLAEAAQQQRAVTLAQDEDGITIRAWLRDAEFQPAENITASARITRADRRTATLTLTPGDRPGLLADRYVPDAPGVHRVDVTLAESGRPPETITRFVRAGVEDREAFQPTRDAALLERIAAVTGGRYFPDGDISELDVALNFSSTGVKRMTVLPLWNLPLWFLLLVGLKLAEWGLRRWWGRI